MGIFEYHNRYSATRQANIRVSKNIDLSKSLSLLISNYSLLRLLRHILIKLIFIVFIFILSYCGNSNYNQVVKCQSLKTNWPQSRISGQVANIITYTRDGSVYVVSDSFNYKYDADLKLIAKIPRDPIATSKSRTSSTLSSPNSLSTTLSETTNNITTLTTTNISSSINETSHNEDSTNKILLSTRFDKGDIILSCWQARNLILSCYLVELNFARGVKILWPGLSKNYRTFALNEQFKALTISDTNDILIASSKLTTPVDNLIKNTDNTIENVPAIGRFRLVLVKELKNYVLQQISVLPYKSEANELNLMYDYIYLFNHNGHTYFILNDIRKPNTSTSEASGRSGVHIGRICNHDTDLVSYIEISLTCNNQAENNYATVAYLNPFKPVPTLFVIFEQVEDINSHIKRSNGKTSLCSYSISLIDDLFNKAINDCNDGDQASILSVKMHSTESFRPPFCQKNPSPSSDWCTSKRNPYIDGTQKKYSVKEDTNLNLHGLRDANFLYATTHSSDLNDDKVKDILFIGTETGFLTKMSLDEEVYYTINLNDNKIDTYNNDKKFRPSDLSLNNKNSDGHKSSKYSFNSRKIYTATSNGSISSLNLFNIDSCKYYTNCRSCLDSRDPLNCLWCSDSCSMEKECEFDKRSTVSCPPLILSVTPKSAPLTGGTKISIIGQNFGLKGTLILKLNGEDCQIDRENSNSEVLECTTKQLDHPTNVTIYIEVADRETSYIYSVGNITISDMFEIVKVRVKGMYPTSGSHLGGTKLTIYGENLDAGLHRKVLLDGTECELVNYTRDQIECSTKPMPHFKSNNTNNYVINTPLETRNLTVFIDGKEQELSLDTKTQYNGNNLDRSFTYIYRPAYKDEEIQTLTINPMEETIEDGGSYFGWIVVILIILAIIIVTLIYTDKLSMIESRLPKLFNRSSSKEGNSHDTRVSFKNPNSIKFSHSTNPMGSTILSGEPIGGGFGVKINGSMMSKDYFGKPDITQEQDQPLILNNLMDGELMSILTQEGILIDKNRLTLGHVLGSGQFGRVYKGFLKVEGTSEHTAVAVKTLHNRTSWDDALDNRAFVDEGLMMKDFNHENVLTLIGVTFDSSGLPMVIIPFMLYGDLRSYISDEASSPTVKELIEFGIQVAKGMAYLSGLKFVHRDLAARNCMLDENLIVKIADFGLSRDIYESDYYSSDNMKTKLPVKWMAIESLDSRIYNTKTDVWSYGVLLWELMTRGVVPYPDVDNFDLYSYLKEGRRMMRPRYCPTILYKIMLTCWDQYPANRPTFDELVLKVTNVIDELTSVTDGQERVIRDTTYCDVIK